VLEIFIHPFYHVELNNIMLTIFFFSSLIGLKTTKNENTYI